MATDMPIGKLVLFEDFLKDVSVYVETNVSGATQDIVNRHGGWWQQVMAGDGADATGLAAEVAWEVDESDGLIFEVRLQITDVSVSSVFVGMASANNLSVVIEDEAGSLNTVAVDAFGFLLEGPQDETWSATGVQNNVDNDTNPVAFTSGDDAADTTTQTLRMEAFVRDSGTVRFFLDGAQVLADQTAFLRTGVVFTPVLSCDDRSTAYNTEYDYFYVSAGRS